MTTRIEWADDVWNPVTGCTKVSPGCKHCYAEVFAERRIGAFALRRDPLGQRVAIPRPFTDVQYHAERLTTPLLRPKPARWFVNSMSDLFHEKVPDGFIEAVFGVMAMCPQHQFIILTKRAERLPQWFERVSWMHGTDDKGYTEKRPVDPLTSCLIRARNYGVREAGLPRLADHIAKSWPLPNVVLGVSVENQEQANARIPHLLATPAAVRAVSCEPLLEMVQVQQIRGVTSEDKEHSVLYFPLTGEVTFDSRNEPIAMRGGGIHWVIVGGESGTPRTVRPMHPAWARSLRDQCVSAGVPFFFKQWGAWVPFDPEAGRARLSAGLSRTERVVQSPGEESVVMFRAGKGLAGRQLDGREWNEFPEMPR